MRTLFEQLGLAAIFAAAGCVLFVLAIWLFTKIAPFSVRKEIEEDQNSAVAIVLASVVVGLAIIVSAAIR